MELWRQQSQVYRQFYAALLIAFVTSVGLFAYSVYRMHSFAYSYLVWNLFLAALPLLFSLRLVSVLRRKCWSDWEPLGWSLLWLLFLPNSFYMISDFIHLREASAADILYTAILFTAFIYLGVLLGFCSLYAVHHELRRRLRPWTAAGWIGLTLLVCSFAIYIGRDLRWNSWDVFVNPGGLLFDVSDRLLRPEAYPTMFVTIAGFFALLSSLYIVVWRVARVLRQAGAREAAAYYQSHRPRR